MSRVGEGGSSWNKTNRAGEQKILSWREGGGLNSGRGSSTARPRGQARATHNMLPSSLHRSLTPPAVISSRWPSPGQLAEDSNLPKPASPSPGAGAEEEQNQGSAVWAIHPLRFAPRAHTSETTLSTVPGPPVPHTQLSKRAWGHLGEGMWLGNNQDSSQCATGTRWTRKRSFTHSAFTAYMHQ